MLTPAPVLVTGGTTVNLLGSFAHATTVTAAAYIWDVKLNGVPYNTGTPTNQQTFNFTPILNGIYNISLAVLDSSGGVSVNNIFVSASGGLAASIVARAKWARRRGDQRGRWRRRRPTGPSGLYLDRPQKRLAIRREPAECGRPVYFHPG